MAALNEIYAEAIRQRDNESRRANMAEAENRMLRKALIAAEVENTALKSERADISRPAPFKATEGEK